MKGHQLYKLNLGSGTHREPGWLNVDIHRNCYCAECLKDGPDLIADIRDLPFEAESATHVLFGHSLEHLPITDVPIALGEAERVLIPGGKLCVVGPCMDKATELAKDPANGTDMRPAIWPGLDEAYPGAGHQWKPTTDEHLRMISLVFPSAAEVSLDDVPAEWPFVRFLYWQFAILAHK